MEKTKRLFVLNINIMLFSFVGIFSKLCANSIGKHGVFHMQTFTYAVLILINCGMYAIFRQQDLMRLDENTAAHEAVCNIWSLLWSVLIFSETVTVGNIVGTMLIIAGIWVMQSE